MFNGIFCLGEMNLMYLGKYNLIRKDKKKQIFGMILGIGKIFVILFENLSYKILYGICYRVVYSRYLKICIVLNNDWKNYG